MCAFPTSPEPFRIEPVFSPRIWGSRSLAPLFPDKTNLAEPIGEAWLTGVECKVATGPFAGKTLGLTWKQMPREWRGSRLASCEDFPILVKFIFPKDKLSIQVHPDDAYAAAHEQAAARGKTEMWHAVAADPGAQVLVGLKPGVDKQKFEQALAQGQLEELFLSHTVQTGDTFFVPAGTPHTIGPGMILCEVQEYSDLTYRVYDYGRVDAAGKPRELHLEKALQVMSFGRASTAKIPSLPLTAEGAKKSLLAACRYFAAERWELLASAASQSAAENFELFVILAGSGYIHWQGSPLEYKNGQCWFVPASLGKFSVQPEQKTAVLRAYVPDVDNLRVELRRAGIPEARVAQTAFA